MKRQTTGQEKIFISHQLTKDLHLKYIWDSQNTTVKKLTIQLEENG